MDTSPIEIQRALAGAEYPATTDELIAVAEENGADDDVLDALQTLGDDAEFDGPDEVSAALAAGPAAGDDDDLDFEDDED